MRPSSFSDLAMVFVRLGVIGIEFVDWDTNMYKVTTYVLKYDKEKSYV